MKSAEWFDFEGTNRERRTRVRLLALLARPQLSETDKKKVRRLVESGAGGGPLLPGLKLHREIRLMAANHLDAMGIDWNSVFADEKPDPRRAVLDHYARSRALKDALDALGEAGIRAVLLKGAALAFFYESPALRPMCDVDILVAGADWQRAGEALRVSGWTPSEGISGVFIDANGYQADVQRPDSAFGELILKHAQRRHARGGNFWVPARSHLLLLTAVHAALHHGERIWRDVCDARLLLAEEYMGERMREAVASVREDGVGEAVAGFFSFLRGMDTLPPGLIADLAELGGKEAARLAKLYEIMAGENSAPAALHLARRVMRPPTDKLGCLKIAGKRKKNVAATLSGSGEVELEYLSQLSRASRVCLAASGALRLMWQGRLWHHGRLALRQRRTLTFRKPFSP